MQVFLGSTRSIASLKSMPNAPVLRYRLASRRAGVFGSSTVGLAVEWLTATWFRFEVFVAWLLIILFGLTQPLTVQTIVVGALVSPLVAVLICVALKITGWVLFFLPGTNSLLGWCRLGWLWTFSRLVVEPAPEIDLPLWLERRKN